MTYLVTLNPDTDHAVSHEVPDDDIHRVIRNAFPPTGYMYPGEAILIRRADYLDTKHDDEVVFERPKLTLIQGGKCALHA